MKVTPWQVEGNVKYEQLVEQFGVDIIDQQLIDRFEKVTGQPIHPWIKRGIFFAHRHLSDILDMYESGGNIFIYTGRGPTSDAMHIGHLIPFMFTKWLQDVLNCYVVIQISDDEKFYFKRYDFNDIYKLGFENSRDILAVGFNPEKTFLFSNRDYRLSTPEYERLAAEMNKKVSFHTLSKVFGLDENSNVGMISWPIYQTIAAFYQAYPHLFKEKALCLVSYAIDQDPYFRLARKIVTKMGSSFYAPCAIIGKFIPPLTGDTGKMSSSSKSESTIFLTDSPDIIKQKVLKYAFSGGGGNGSLADHRKYGGNINVDIPCIYLKFFEFDDNELEKIYNGFSEGKMTCGETKQLLVNKLIQLITNHQREREKITQDTVEYYYRKLKYMPDLHSPYTNNPPCFSYPGTILHADISDVVKQYVCLQANAIGTHTRRELNEEGFQKIQELEREYIYWIGKLFCRKENMPIKDIIDGYLCGGGTEANIQGLWVQRNRLQSSGYQNVHVYMTVLTHYSIIKACDLLGIPKCNQHIIDLNDKYEMDAGNLKKIIQNTDIHNQSNGHIIVATIGTTATGSCDNIEELNQACNVLPGDNIGIHIDAAFGGFTVPYVSNMEIGFEFDKVLTIGLDAHKMGGLPYPAGIFLCRKNLQKNVEINVDYLYDHADDTLSGSRSAIPAICGTWFIHNIGFEGQKNIVEQCLNARNRLVSLLHKIPFVSLLPYSNYTNMLAMKLEVSDEKREALEKRYLLRYIIINNEKIYKLCIMPHTINAIDEFANYIQQLI